MNRCSAIAFACLCTVFANAQAETAPVVRGLWVLPTEFKDTGKVWAQPQFAKEGRSFLEAFKKRTIPDFSPVILEGPNVIKSKVLETLQEQLKLLTAPGSIFVFYYAGHGVRPSKDTFLGMQSCEVGTPDIAHDDDMLMLQRILDLQANYEGVYFIAYIDACYSGNQFVNADQYLWSERLGPRGFLLCSSGADRKSYIPKFTQALTTVYGSDDRFKNVQNPNDLLREVKSANDYPAEQVPHLIPDNCYLQTIYPLPGLCFYSVDFGGIYNKPITVKISSGNGRGGNFSFNDKSEFVGSIAFPVQQLEKISMTVNFNSNYEVPFDVDLSGKSFDSKSLADKPIPDRRTLTSASAKSQLAAAASNYQAIVERAKNFGLDDTSVTHLCTRLLASTFRGLDPNKSAGFISEQVAYLMAKAPTSSDLDGLGVFASTIPSRGPEQLAALDKAIDTKIPVPKHVVVAYAKNLEVNVSVLKSDQTAAWVKPEDLTAKITKASVTAKKSNSSEAKQVLARTVEATSDPENRILSHHDYHAAKHAVFTGSLPGG